jgi:hypothetical protein
LNKKIKLGTQFYTTEKEKEENVTEKGPKSYITTYLDLQLLELQMFEKGEEKLKVNLLLKDISIKDKVLKSNRGFLFFTQNIKEKVEMEHMLSLSYTQHDDNSISTEIFLDKQMIVNMDQHTLHFLLNFFCPFLDDGEKQENKETVTKENSGKTLLIKTFCISDIFLELNFAGRGKSEVFKKFINSKIQKLFLKVAGCFSLSESRLELHSRYITNCTTEELKDKLIDMWFPSYSSTLRILFSVAKGNVIVKRMINLELTQGTKFFAFLIYLI